MMSYFDGYYIGDTIQVVHPKSYGEYSDLNGSWKNWIKRAASSSNVTIRSKSSSGSAQGWIAVNNDAEQRDTGWVPLEWMVLILSKRQGRLFL